MKLFIPLFFLLASGVLSADSLPLDQLKLPLGYKISVYAEVPDARSLSLTPDGRLFVGTMHDAVYVVKDGKAQIFAQGLHSPNGVAYKDGKLYVAEIDRILEFDGNSKILPQKKFKVLPQKFPSDRHHGWKFIRFGPDGLLYVPVGAPCNICDPKKEYARIFKIDVNGATKTEVAKGIRNTVGFDWSPKTKELWFTDNGRDLLGDEIPPDEINRVGKKKGNVADPSNIPDYGFPYCHGKNISDPEFGKQKSCKDSIAPEFELPAHVAALGMRFFNGNILIAEHGSWNRSTPIGYRVVLATLRNDKIEKAENFVDGWLQPDGKKWGRPVDVEVAPHGVIYISDDMAGVVYKLSK